jgi:alpha-L-rhamnosidase
VENDPVPSANLTATAGTPAPGKRKIWNARIAVLFVALLVSIFPGPQLRPAEVAQISLQPDGLKCEWQSNPLAVNSTTPHLSWTLVSTERDQYQTAYQVLVASSLSRLAAENGDLWNSGKVDSSRTIEIAYQGKPLASRETCYWKVRVWDKEGHPSPWSAPAYWTEGLLKPSDWTAQWIGDGESSQKHTSAVVLRRDFHLRENAKRAIAYVCGLGQFELHLNGKKVSEDVLTPGWTNYRKSDLYLTYDVTPLLRKGPNTVAVMLGNGMYNVEKTARYTKFVGSFGPPKLIFQLEITYADGSTQRVVSDASWRVLPSPVTFNSIYGGEDFDARLETAGWDKPGLKDSAFPKAVIMAPPGGRLMAQEIPPIRVMQVYKPVKITEPEPGVYVYDLGQNMSGWPQIAVRGPRGASVKIVPGELLDPQGLVTQRSSGSPEWFRYTLKGSGIETWHPRFSYYGFRYLQIEGATRNPAESNGKPVLISVAGDFVHSSAAAAGTFSCSFDLFNHIHHIIRAAIESNMQSVLTDCPHREKLGWLEQSYLMGPAVMYDFDVARLYAKIIRDTSEAQLPDGLVPDTAPEFAVFGGEDNPFRNAPVWGSASILAAWETYRRYGDLQVLQDNYTTFERYAAYLGSRARDHIVSFGLGDWYDLGPKPAGFAQLTPIAFTSTATYYRDLVTLSRISAVLGKKEKAEGYAALAGEVKKAFNRKFFHPETDSYATGSQTSNAMPLALGLAPPSARALLLKNIIHDIRVHGNAMTTGEVGFPSLLRVLEDAGRSDVIFNMNSRRTAPGYGYILKRGATTLTESWTADPRGSQNHFMIGHIEDWFYRGLAGISQSADSVGYKKIVIKPQPVGNITWCKADYNSVRGEIRSEWSRENGRFNLNVTLPPNTRDEVYVPATSSDTVTESGRPAAESPGVHFLRMADGYAIYQVGSGTYHFAAPANDQEQHTPATSSP